MAVIELSKALRLPVPPRVAIVGGGGKTTTLFRLARELAGPVIVTSTTHLAKDQLLLADRYFEIHSEAGIQNFPAGLVEGVNLFMGPPLSNKTSGLDPASLDRLLGQADRYGYPLLIEADGSRGRPLKAPAAHEPAIPGFANTVIVVVGLSGAGQPVGEEWVHRVERFAALAGVNPGEPATPEAMVKVLCHPEGGLRNIPPGARRVVLVNQADKPGQIALVEALAGRPYAEKPGLLQAFESVIGSKRAAPIAVYEPCAGVVLAAGGSRRWREAGQEQPKQLALIDGEAMVRRSARLAVEAGLDPVIVVTGSQEAEVRSAVAGLQVQVVHCAGWEAGMSASLKQGLAAVPGKAGSALFLLADQPYLTTGVVHELLRERARTFSLITAPRVEGKRTNPVLFDRRLFPELMQVSGDQGGRALFESVAPGEIAWVDFPDPRVFLDIDRAADVPGLG